MYLAHLFSADAEHQVVPRSLAEEFALLQDLLEIQQARYGERLHYQLHLSEAEEEGCSLLLPEVTARMVVLTAPTDPDEVKAELAKYGMTLMGGFTPVVLDDLSAGRRDFVKFGPLVNACVSDAVAVQKAVAEHNIQAVIDLAGSIEVAESVRQAWIQDDHDRQIQDRIAALRANAQVEIADPELAGAKAP